MALESIEGNAPVVMKYGFSFDKSWSTAFSSSESRSECEIWSSDLYHSFSYAWSQMGLEPLELCLFVFGTRPPELRMVMSDSPGVGDAEQNKLVMVTVNSIWTTWQCNVREIAGL